VSAIEYLKRFATTGSICPSSTALAQAVFDEVSGLRHEMGEVIFAGIGSGIIARQFLAKTGKTVFIDIDENFCRRFSENVCSENHSVICTDILDYLANHPGGRERTLVCCLPLRGAYFSKEVVDALARESRLGTKIVLFTYLPYGKRSRAYRALAQAEANLYLRRIVLLNVPPAMVYATVAPQAPPWMLDRFFSTRGSD